MSFKSFLYSVFSNFSNLDIHQELEDAAQRQRARIAERNRNRQEAFNLLREIDPNGAFSSSDEDENDFNMENQQVLPEVPQHALVAAPKVVGRISIKGAPKYTKDQAMSLYRRE
uniref:TIMELESS-interacting protein n=1 Tax=Caenorhabditis tropicalis TaxID=1561998 RepID=A0A1I7SZW8_9PELO